MSQPTAAMVRIDQPLSNFAVEYKNEEYVGLQVAPRIPVNNKSDSYFVFSKKNAFQSPDDIIGPEGYANEINWSASTGDYYCKNRGLKKFIADERLANSDPAINMRRRTTEKIVNDIMLNLERRISAAVTTYGNYSSSYRTQLSGGDTWDSPATSDPIGNIETARQAVFKMPNTIVMGYQVWAKLKVHPQILDRISGGSTNASPAMVTKQLVAELFEVDNLIVGSAKYLSSNAGQTTETYGYIWGKDVVVCYVEPRATMNDVTSWATFGWRQFDTGTIYKVRTYREEAKGGGGEWIEVNTSYDIKTVCTDTAYLIDTVIA